MAIDAYSLCPGGTGKKVKFCCSDLLGDLKTLDRMMEGEQHKAALQHIESIESVEKPRACLLALKISLLRRLEQDEPAGETIRRFVEHFPENPIALAESAIERALDADGPAAMQLLQGALAHSEDQLYEQIYYAMTVVAQVLASSRDFRAARALWQIQSMANPDDAQPRELIRRASCSEGVSLLIKEEPPLEACPEDAAWKDRFEEALQPLNRANWAEAAKRLGDLLEEAPEAPSLWQNLANIRSWLADRPGAVEAYEKLSTLDIPLEDAIEAKATAMMMSDEPLDDAIDGVRLTFPVDNAEELAGHFATWKHAVSMPFDPNAFGEEEVPPKAMFWLLDRPTPASPDDLTLETVPSVLGQAMLFGRQTDRAARLVVSGVLSTDREVIESLLHSVADGQITGSPEAEVIAPISATRSLLRRPWRLPPETSVETIEALANRHLEDAIIERWPRLRLGIFDGRSIEEVAAAGDQRIPLMAAILVLENWVWQMRESLDFDRLRQKLGLPTLGPVDPETNPIESLSLVRFHRVMVDKLSDESLINGFRRAFVLGAHEAVNRFGDELIERPNVGSEEKQRALAAMIQNGRDPERALGYIERGRQMAEAAGESSAPWDLNEMELRMARGEAAEGARLFDHLKEEHLREPGVAEALREFLVRAGVIDEQGRPLVPDMPDADMSEELQDAPSGGLWTPGGESSSGEKPKLWTPDMG